MAAYRRVDDLRSPAGWLPVHRDQLRAQRSVSSMGSLYLFLLRDAMLARHICCVALCPSDRHKSELSKRLNMISSRKQRRMMASRDSSFSDTKDLGEIHWVHGLSSDPYLM